MFKCILCGHTGGEHVTSHKPRDKKDLNIVDCPICGHRQLYPLLSDEELKDEYDTDKMVRSMTPTSDFEAMKIKFAQWTKIHADMYWDMLQTHEKVLNLGSGYGFLEQELNRRNGRKFEIEGDDIGKFRLDHWVGGTVHTVNFLSEQVPTDMKGQYDLVMALHLLEHINEPVKYLHNLLPLFTKNGKILIEVPNLNSFLYDLSPEYAEFFYLYEHVSYFTADTLKAALILAGYRNVRTYTKELYSIENHINWMRTGKPFTKYNQMYLENDKIEWINENYKKKIGEMGRGFALIAEAEADAVI